MCLTECAVKNGGDPFLITSPTAATNPAAIAANAQAASDAAKLASAQAASSQFRPIDVDDGHYICDKRSECCDGRYTGQLRWLVTDNI